MYFLRSILNSAADRKLSVFLFHKVPISADPLVPHDLDQEKFGRVLEFIAQHFHVLPLADAVKLLSDNKLPARSAAITFDDGYPEWVDGAAKMLSQRNLPATFFITTGQFEGRPMWHERLANVVRMHRNAILDTQFAHLPSIKTESIEDKIAAIQKLEFHFKYLPVVMRDEYLLELESKVGTSYSGVALFTSGQLQAIANMGFEIGAHTVDHPILSLCDASRAYQEIGQAREMIEAIIGRQISSFAYPNGRPAVDFSHKHIEMVKACGYEYAVTTQWGVGRSGTSPFQIPRFTPWGPTQRQMFLQMLRNMYARPESIQETSV